MGCSSAGQTLRWQLFSDLATTTPTGHRATLTLVNADDADHTLFIDGNGYAEEVFADDSAIYRTGEGIAPPPEPPTSVVIDNVTFDFASSGSIDNPLLQAMPATFRGYWGQLPDQRQEHSWQALTVAVSGSDVLLPVQTRLVTTRQDPENGLTLQTDSKLFATDSTGAVRELSFATDANGTTVTGVIGVAAPAVVALNAIGPTATG